MTSLSFFFKIQKKHLKSLSSPVPEGVTIVDPPQQAQQPQQQQQHHAADDLRKHAHQSAQQQAEWAEWYRQYQTWYTNTAGAHSQQRGGHQ